MGRTNLLFYAVFNLCFLIYQMYGTQNHVSKNLDKSFKANLSVLLQEKRNFRGHPTWKWPTYTGEEKRPSNRPRLLAGRQLVNGWMTCPLPLLQAEELDGLLLEPVPLAFNVLPDPGRRLSHNFLLQRLYLKL